MKAHLQALQWGMVCWIVFEFPMKVLGHAGRQLTHRVRE